MSRERGTKKKKKCIRESLCVCSIVMTPGLVVMAVWLKVLVTSGKGVLVICLSFQPGDGCLKRKGCEVMGLCSAREISCMAVL